MSNRTYVSINECDVTWVTDMAVMLEIDGVEYWIPRSQIEDGDSVEVSDNQDLELTDWICDQKGLV